MIALRVMHFDSDVAAAAARVTHVFARKAGASKNIADKHGLTPLEPSVCAVQQSSAQRCTQRIVLRAERILGLELSVFFL